MFNDAVSKRFTVTVPDYVFEDLERLADIQGRPTANLAAFLIEIGVRAAKERGELSEQNGSSPSPQKTKGAA